MQYMILIYANAVSEAAVRGEARDEFEAAHQGVIRELTASGELIQTYELAIEDAKHLRAGDRSLPRDGPYAPCSEWVGGYYLVAVDGKTRALEIAARFVEARYASIEVRRLA